MIEACTRVEHPGWLALRSELWPHHAESEHLAEMHSFLAEPERFAQFIFYSAPKVAVGLVEASLRRDYVPGTSSSPVAFLEGIYVTAALRRQGIARRLVGAVESWARDRGCTEFASDTQLHNADSQAVHKALGFVETERIVCFARSIR